MRNSTVHSMPRVRVRGQGGTLLRDVVIDRSSRRLGRASAEHHAILTGFDTQHTVAITHNAVTIAAFAATADAEFAGGS
jgi:hypothetical protein